jgi:hypothetical protein
MFAEQSKSFIDKMQSKIGKEEFKYSEASMTLFELFKDPEF